MRKFVVIHRQSDACVFVTYTPTEEAALNEFAGFRSGYDTLTEMARSATFLDMANVSAFPA